MSETSKITTVSDCNEKPKFWDDDLKMDAWFAPFRNRDLNPLNFDNKLAFWKHNVEFFCEKTNKVLFTLAEVRTFFVRNGKMPNCLQLVFENLLREGRVQSLSEYENSVMNNSWTSWALNTFVTNPLKWSLDQVKNKMINSSTFEINENTEYVCLLALKKQSEDLYKIVTKDLKESLLTYENVQQILSSTAGIKRSLKTIKLMVHCLEQDGKAHVVFENKHYNIHLIKFSNSALPVSPITDSEISVYVLQKKETLLIEKIKTLESEKDQLIIEVKGFLRQKMKNMARNTLRKEKELEKRIDKLVNVLENIQSLLYKVQDTEADSQILASYKVGAHALKSGITQGDLNLTNVDSVMNEIENALDMYSDVQDTLGQVVSSQQNNADLESELAELLIDDAPTVPPKTLSPDHRSQESEQIEDERVERYRHKPFTAALQL